MAGYYATHPDAARYAERALARMSPVVAVCADLEREFKVRADVATAIVAEVRRIRARTLDEDDIAEIRSAAIMHATESLRMLDVAGDRLERAFAASDASEWEALHRATIALCGARRVALRDVITAVIPRGTRQSATPITDEEFTRRALAAQR